MRLSTSALLRTRLESRMRPFTSKCLVRTVGVKVTALPQFLLPYALNPSARACQFCLRSYPKCSPSCQLHHQYPRPSHPPPLLVNETASYLVSLPAIGPLQPRLHTLARMTLNATPLFKILPWLPIATRIKSRVPPMAHRTKLELAHLSF